MDSQLLCATVFYWSHDSLCYKRHAREKWTFTAFDRRIRLVRSDTKPPPNIIPTILIVVCQANRTCSADRDIAAASGSGKHSFFNHLIRLVFARAAGARSAPKEYSGATRESLYRKEAGGRKIPFPNCSRTCSRTTKFVLECLLEHVLEDILE